MESLDKSHHVDLESGGGGGGGHGGGGGNNRCSTAVNGCGSSSPDEGRGHSSVGEHKSEIVRELDKRRESSVSDCSVELVDLEAGRKESRLAESRKTEKDCRICHLSLDPSNQESGAPIELGCSCKDDLAAAHKQCAETWFKIKGNKTCEICGSIARNVAGVTEAELSEDDDSAAHNTRAPQAETRNFWQGHRFLNFLLACMVFAFVISWLFHFNVPS